MKTSDTSRHNPYLDGLRGIAALVVVMYHSLFNSVFWGGEGFQVQYFGTLHRHAGVLHINGNPAVDLFFLLSGFVIAGAYDRRIDEGRMGMKDFLLTRFIRLFPTLFLSVVWAVLLTSAVIVVRYQGDFTLLRNVFLLGCANTLLMPLQLDVHRLNVNFMFLLNPPLWSLYYEVVINVIYRIFHRQLTTRVLPGIVGISLVIALALIYRVGCGGVKLLAPDVLTGLFRCSYGFFLGVLLFRHREWLHEILGKILLPVPLAMGLATLGMLVPYHGHLPDFLVVALDLTVIFPLCVLSLSFRPRVSDFGRRILLWLGDTSYPIYLLHAPLLTFLTSLAPQFLNRTAPVSGLLFLTGILVLSSAVETYYEFPVRRWMAARLKAGPKNP